MSEQNKGKFEEIGALWLKQGSNGKFYAGYVELNGERVDVFLFSNKGKKNEKAPDLRLVLAPPREGQPSTNKVAPKQVSAKAPVKAPAKQVAPPEEEEDEAPF